MIKTYALLFLTVLTIPVLLGVNAWQSNECGEIRNEIKILERSQEQCVTENKAVASEIADLLAAGRVEAEAQKLGLQKMRPEDVVLIVMEKGKKGNGL
jgi:cell division protein FtsL